MVEDPDSSASNLFFSLSIFSFGKIENFAEKGRRERFVHGGIYEQRWLVARESEQPTIAQDFFRILRINFVFSLGLYRDDLLYKQV